MASANPANVARGLNKHQRVVAEFAEVAHWSNTEAAISNPNNSEEEKERTSHRLEEMEASDGLVTPTLPSATRFLQAAISNPNVSEETKEHCAQVLEEL
ncbi:hypothetical protein BKA93DRAFT_830209 [Sparassis latifolia]